MAIQVRRGESSDFNPNRLLPGEFAVVLDTQEVYMCFAAGATYRLATYDRFEEDAVIILENAEYYKNSAYDYYKYSKSYAIGQGGLVNEKTNNSKYYCEQAQIHSQNSSDFSDKAKEYRDDAESFAKLAESFTPSGYEELAEKVNAIEYLTDEETRNIFY